MVNIGQICPILCLFESVKDIIMNIKTLTQLQQMEAGAACQKATIAAYNHYIENGQIDHACEIADWVVGDAEESLGRNTAFSADFQMHCIRYLIDAYYRQYAESENGSEAEEQAAERLHMALWRLKWVIEGLPEDTSCSLADIEEANQFMQQIYGHFEFDLAVMYKMLMYQNVDMGNAAAAKQYFAQWREHADSDDLMADCAACEQHALVVYHHFIGEYEQALKYAQPILSGKMSCGKVPHETYVPVIDSLIRLKRHQEAEQYLVQALDLLESNIEPHIHILPRLIWLCSLLGLSERVEELFEEYGDLIAAYSQNSTLAYLRYVMAAVAVNDEALPEAQRVAKVLDERNGNSHYQTLLERAFTATALH